MASVEDCRRLKTIITSVENDHIVEVTGYALDAVGKPR